MNWEDSNDTPFRRVQEEVRKLTYPQIWSAYNEAQTKERIYAEKLLIELLDCFPPDYLKIKGGKPGTPIKDRIYSMFIYAFCGHSSRRCISELTFAKERNIIESIPHFNTLLSFFSNKSLTRILTMLIRITSLPLKRIETHCSIDSSGFSTNVRERWLDIRTQRVDKKKHWKKAHLIVGARTNIITSIEITTGNRADSPFLKPLFEQTIKYYDMVKEFSDEEA
jgi:hypothetical protein